jgi:dienelactone hydrolase
MRSSFHLETDRLTMLTCGPMQPAVLIAHTAIGPQEEFITNKAHALARQGYAAFALDLFGAGHCVYGDEKDVYNGELRKNRNMIAERALAALATVQALPDVDPTRVAAIGFCLGGKCVLDLLRAAPPNGFLRGVVSFHGILDGGPRDAMRSVQQQKAPGPGVRALAIHGYKDPFVSDEMLLAFFKDMESRRVDFEVRIVGPVVLHAFMRPDKTSAADAEIGLQYNEVIAQRSWQAMLDFLQEVLAT